MQPVEIVDNHYLAITGTYDGDGDVHGLRYVLLASNEQRLNELARTRLTLLLVSLAGILVSGLTVWYLIRHVTQPPAGAPGPCRCGRPRRFSPGASCSFRTTSSAPWPSPSTT
ncbi:MAG: hypothetical protein WDM96_16195 [Lacunisphaera sp.]